MSERISYPSTPKTTVPLWPATQAAADTSATWSAEAVFSIFSLCLKAGLRPPAGGQLLLLAAAARWRCCHDHDGGVLLLIRRSASGRQVVHRGALQKLFHTSMEFLRWKITQAGQKRGAACNKSSKITHDTVANLLIFRRTYVPILERNRNFGHLS